MTDAIRPGIDSAELAQERERWEEICDLIESLSEEQVERPGYFPDGWSVKDMLGHIGTWMAEAGMVLEQIRFGTYRAEEIDIDALNARFLEAMRDVPMGVVRAQASASRARMLRHWAALPERTLEAEQWVRKSGPKHYDEHLPRLRERVAEMGLFALGDSCGSDIRNHKDDYVGEAISGHMDDDTARRQPRREAK